MITYVYRCASCLHEYEIQQSIKDKPISLCPACHQSTCERLICEPIVIDMGAKTVGGQADKNSRKQSSYELQEKRENRLKRNELAGKTLAEQVSGGQRVKGKEQWYHKQNSVKQKQIQKMDKKQKEKFIFEGKS